MEDHTRSSSQGPRSDVDTLQNLRSSISNRLWGATQLYKEPCSADPTRSTIPDNRFEWRDTHAAYPEDSGIVSQSISHEKTLSRAIGSEQLGVGK
jgi:hypothetical protein